MGSQWRSSRSPWKEFPRRACPLSGTWVPPIFLDEPGGIGDDDLVASGPDHAILPQLTQDPYHDLPSVPTASANSCR